MKKCLNCGFTLDDSFQYCPKCGQSSKVRRVSFRLLVMDFLGDFFNFDSKFFKSIIPLLFKPGFLTAEFIRGKRIEYIPPLRFYLFISFIYFLLLSYKTSDLKIRNISVGDSQQEFMQADSLLRSELKKADTLSALKGDSADSSGFERKGINFFLPDNDSFASNFGEITALEKTGMEESEIADSLGVTSGLPKKLLTNSIKFYRTQGNAFFQVLFSNTSWMMFALIPVFALILKILYIRKDYFYLDHLIFGFHFHTFLFLILIIFLFTGVVKILTAVMIGIIFLYLLLAMINTYRENIFKTFLKLFGLVLMYTAGFFIAALTTAFISILLM